MERLKTHIFNRFHIVSTLLVATGISLLLLMLRLKLTHSYFLLFLVWNMFLAALPYTITFYLSTKDRINKYRLFVWLGLWLLFLPNAPYIVTDMVHLGHLKADFIVFDTVLISAYALCGLLYYFLSLRDMELILQKHFSEKKSTLFIWAVPFMVGFGVYLGRFLRWNSWDMVQRPHKIITDVWEILIYPSEHQLAWLFTFSFGMGLWLIYLVFKRIEFFRIKKQD